jgi:hypothetical protein
MERASSSNSTINPTEIRVEFQGNAWFIVHFGTSR